MQTFKNEEKRTDIMIGVQILSLPRVWVYNDFIISSIYKKKRNKESPTEHLYSKELRCWTLIHQNLLVARLRQANIQLLHLLKKIIFVLEIVVEANTTL